MTRTRRELAGFLTEWGTEDTPPPRAAFVDELEARLTGGGVVAPAVAPIDRRPSRRPLLVAAAAVVAVIAVGVSVIRDDGPSAPSRLEAADRAEGTSSTAVEDGPVADEFASGEPVSTTAGRRPGSRTTTGGSATSETSEAPEGSAPAEPETPATTSPDVPAPAANVARFELRGWGTAARVFLEWDAYRGDDFAAYLVLRSIPPEEPEYGDERTLMERRIEDRDSTAYDTTPKVGTAPNHYRVVVIDREGRMVAVSNVVEPQSNPEPTAGSRRLTG